MHGRVQERERRITSSGTKRIGGGDLERNDLV